MTQLDPIACDACLAKMKGHGNSGAHGVSEAVAGPLGMWQTLPEAMKIGIAAAALVIGLLIGLVIGFVAGQATSSNSADAKMESTHAKESSSAEEPEDRPTPPGPGYKWVPCLQGWDSRRWSLGQGPVL
jgi:Na+/glutamate symporter